MTRLMKTYYGIYVELCWCFHTFQLHGTPETVVALSLYYADYQLTKYCSITREIIFPPTQSIVMIVIKAIQFPICTHYKFACVIYNHLYLPNMCTKIIVAVPRTRINSTFQSVYISFHAITF